MPEQTRLRVYGQGSVEVELVASYLDDLKRAYEALIWEFLGTLNPLEVIRKYLNDRHERRKDREYRESAEQRRLALDNLSLETRVISERVRLAKELGATERDLASLLNELIYKPLGCLDRYQDKDIIARAEIAGDVSREHE